MVTVVQEGDFWPSDAGSEGVYRQDSTVQTVTSPEIAWAAGLFEGEGCISVKSNYLTTLKRAYTYPLLQLGMSDADVVERFATIVDCGKVYFRSGQTERHKDMWIWTATRMGDAVRVLQALMPFFGERRREVAEMALEDANFILEREEQRIIKKEAIERDVPPDDESSIAYRWRKFIIGVVDNTVEVEFPRGYLPDGIIDGAYCRYRGID